MTLEPPLEFPRVRPGEPIVVSATTFVTFERCPDQAGGRMRGIYGPESRASFTGGLAHRVFARHLREGPIAAEDFTTTCRREIGESMNVKLSALGLKPSELGRVIEDVGGLYERFRTLSTEGFSGAEVFLEVELPEDVTLRGSIDAVFDEGIGGMRLVDWKTGSLGDADLQLDFYAMLWALERGELPGRLEAVSVKTGERTEAVPSRAGVGETAGRVAAAIDALREAWGSGEPMARRAGPWCRWCPLLDDCSEGRSATEVLQGGSGG